MAIVTNNPICPFCYHREGKKEFLLRLPHRMSRSCRKCKTEFTEEYLAEYKYFKEGNIGYKVPNLDEPPTVASTFLNHMAAKYEKDDPECVARSLRILYDEEEK